MEKLAFMFCLFINLVTPKWPHVNHRYLILSRISVHQQPCHSSIFSSKDRIFVRIENNSIPSGFVFSSLLKQERQKNKRYNTFQVLFNKLSLYILFIASV